MSEVRNEPNEDLKNRFGFHPAKDPAVQQLHSETRQLLLSVATVLDAILPPGREHAVVLTSSSPPASLWATTPGQRL